MPTDLLDRWLAAVVATPGLTALRDPDDARRVLLDDALRGRRRSSSGRTARSSTSARAAEHRESRSPHRLPDREVTLLEAERRKCDFLERWTAELPNLRVVWGRAEEQPLESYGVAVAKALAHPPTAAEWCLPLVREGGAVVLWVGPSVDEDRGRRRSRRTLAGRLEPAPAGFVLSPQDGPDPAGLPPPHGRRSQAAARLRSAVRRRVAGAERPVARLPWVCAGPDLRDREPEGRRRQDDDRRQPRRLPRRGRRALPDRRPRPPGERDLGARAPRQRPLDARPPRRHAAGGARRRPSSLANLDLVPAKAGARGGDRAPLRARGRRALPRRRARATRRRSPTGSSSSTARRRSAR